MNDTDMRIPPHEPTGSIVPHLAILLVQVAGLAGPQFPGRNQLFSAAIIALAVTCHLNHFTNNLGLANIFALAWPHYLATLCNFMFASSEGPEADLWRTDGPPREPLLWRAYSPVKMRWAIATLINLRGIRWSYATKNIPQRVHAGARMSRLRFIALQAVDLCWTLLMADLVSQLGVRFFFTDPTSSSFFRDSKYLTVPRGGPLLSLARCFVYGAGPYFFINMQYLVCSIVAVVLGVSDPEDWPPLFGKLAHATTVRNFWAKFWHQMIRRGLTSFSTAFARSLGLRRGSNWYSYAHLWAAFILSGTMHAGSMLILPAPSNITLRERTLGVFLFFIWQAAAITIEDLVQWAWRQAVGARQARWTTVVGYVWVVFSFWCSLPLAGNVMLRLRMGEDTPLPVSVTKALVQRVPLE